MSIEDAGSALEDLWAGEFGDAYVERNRDAAHGREDFWRARIEQADPASVLEVGCNLGGNLRPLAELVGAEKLAGIDVNETAVKAAREAVPGADIRRASAYEIPFDDASIDLVFTTGVLIHLPPDGVEKAVDEIVRCSSRWILCGEYFAEQEEEVLYRGQEEALFRRDYGGIYQRRHPDLKLVEQGFLSASEESSWDDVTWWLFERA
jgi:pseudaminic acid biosynthesis-associated methylase